MSPSGRSSSGIFTSRELMRMVSGVLLLGVIGMMYLQNRKTAARAEIEAQIQKEAAKGPTAPWQERIVPDDGHTDTEQIAAFQEESQALSDNAPLTKEEMAAYWRLFRWAGAVSGDDLLKQARADITFTHLFQDPDKYRGALVSLRMHVRRVRTFEAPQNSAGVTNTFEAWGPTEESQTYPYCVAVAELPPGMQVEQNAFYDARFVGFFLKKLYYEDGLGAKRSAPLLIGRVVYDNVISVQSQPPPPLLTTPWIVGLCMALISFVVLVQLWARATPKRPPVPSHDEATVDAFLGTLQESPLSNLNPSPPSSQPPIDDRLDSGEN